METRKLCTSKEPALMEEDLTLYSLVSNINQWEDRFAVVYDCLNGMVTMTYGQIMKLADKISSILQCQTESPDIIGLCLEPSHFVPAVLFGVLKSGNAFLNFLANSLGYIQSVLDQIEITVLLIQSSKLEVLEKLLFNYKSEIIHSDTTKQMDIVLVKLKRTEYKRRNRTSLAYCITTSGTTGTPKVVRVPHKCIVPNIVYQRKLFGITSKDIVFLASPLTFDPSIVDIFVTLSSGACLVITSDSVKTMPEKLIKILTNYQISVLQCTPTLFSRFSTTDIQTKLLCQDSSIRILGLGGEKFPSLSLLQHWRGTGNRTKFYNLYGITEVSCWSSIYELSEEDFRNKTEDIPLGKPMIDTVYKVKGSEGQILTEGKGILFIESSKRICYINEEAHETVEQIIERCTGDIVNVSSNGDVVYVGRADNQIKRNGKRIDLSEIEQLVCKRQDVVSCKVLYENDILLAVVVPVQSDSDGSESVESTAIIQKVAGCIQNYLPVHCWPDTIISVNKLPMTKHGKCDTDALLKAVFSEKKSRDSSEDYDCYFSQLWKESLGVTIDVKPEDKFIFNGGDSVKALQLANRLQAELNMQLPWILDFILHRSFCDILTAIKNTLEKNYEISAKENSVDEKPKLSIQNENTSSEKIITKRKHLEDKGNEDKELHQEKKSRIELTFKDPVPIRCRLRVVSKCNMCSDWVIDTDETVTKYLKQKYFRSMQTNHVLTNDPSLAVETDDNKTVPSSVANRINSEEENACPKTGAFQLSLNEKWIFDTGKCVDASPLIASLRDGRMVVFIGSHSHRFSAILMDTGQVLWETTLGDRIESSACMTLCGNYVIVGCYDYCLYALNSLTGEVWWKYKTGGEVKSSPVVDPHTSLVIVGSHDQHVHAVNVKNKLCAWCTDIGSGSVFASPCICVQPHLIFVATLGGMVAALQGDTGSLLWKYNCYKPVFSSPAVMDDGICFGCVDGNVYHLDFEGHLIWKFTTGAPVFSSPTYTDKIFIGSHDSQMYCLSKKGHLIWKMKVDSAVYSSAFCFSLHENRQEKNKGYKEVDNFTGISNNYGHFSSSLTGEHFSECSTNQTTIRKFKTVDSVDFNTTKSASNVASINESVFEIVTFASTNGNFYIVNVVTGEIIHFIKMPGEVFSSPVVYDNCVVIGCRNDYVYCLSMK